MLSPEKAILDFRLAGIGSRILAHLLDLVLIFATIMIVSIMAQVMSMADEGIGTFIILMSSFLIPFLYFILFEWLWNGQTIGKKALGIRVMMEDGTPITFPAALGRNLLRPADFLPVMYFAGIVTIFTNPRSQRLGDLVAKTVVAHHRRVDVIETLAPHALTVHPFESHVGDLRGMSLEEYDALRRLCDRFPDLSPDIQVKLLQEVWEPIARRRKIEPVKNVHPLYLAEATVMKFGRERGLI